MERKGSVLPTYLIVIIFLLIGIIVFVAFPSVSGFITTLVDGISCKMQQVNCLIGHSLSSCKESVVCIVK
ncbi:Uncharacterised protein [uncultured archaeon]|nr:Uncharacterised protein [uncultured archaeon]